MLKEIALYKKELAIGTASSAVALFLYKTIKTYLWRRKYSKIPGPKTKGILGFYFGHYFELNKRLAAGELYPDILLEWAEKYGPVFVFQFLDDMTIITTEPEAVREIIVRKDFPKKEVNYKAVGYPLKERLVGEGLVTDLNRENWKKRRHLLNTGFHRNYMMACLQEFNIKADVFNQKLRSFADGKTPVSLFVELNRLALDVIGLVAFGLDIDSVNDPSAKLNHYITKSLGSITLTILDPLVNFKPYKRKQVNELKGHIRTLRKYSEEKILQRIKEIENGEHVPNDILTIMISDCKDPRLEMEAIIDDFLTFFIAGQETTANALAFAFLELGKNPRILKQAREEVDRVLGEKVSILPEDLANLEYCSLIFRETLRKWPVIAEFSRTSTEDIKINGYNIASGTTFQLVPYLSGRDKRHFPNPEEFLPERFSTEQSKNTIVSGTYYPFSLGSRNCIGQVFSQIEAKVILAKFIQCFDFELVPNQSYKVREYTTLRPEDGVKVFLKPRNKKLSEKS